MIARADRSVGPTALLPAAVAGLSWSPTFSATALALPVLLPLLAVLAVDQLTPRRKGSAVVRPVVGLLLGTAVLVLTFRVLDGASVAEVMRGIVGGWQRTLGSTLPARPDPAVMAYVPSLALLAGVLGVEWARHGAGPLPTLLPGLAVLTLGQLVRAATGGQALAVATAAGAAAVGVLLTQHRRASWVTAGRRRVGRASPQLLATVAVAALAAWGAVGLGIPGRATFSVAHDPDDTPPLHTADPLDQIAVLLAHGDETAFTVRTGTPPDRWPLVVLDRFDGVSWTSSGRFLELGAGLVPPPVAVATTPARAEVSDVRLQGPWLPSQQRLRTVEGTQPLVDPRTGALLGADTGPVASYAISWDDVRIGADGLAGSTIDPDAAGALAVDTIPAGIAELAREAVGPDSPPSVQTALLLEKSLREPPFHAASVDRLPTGHSTAQLLHFLNKSRYGTSEQFASAYALMARSLGIPVRLVLGFRNDGSGTVHNRDVLAWPEIAVRGLGWVPLDPTPQATDAPPPTDDLAAATQAARDRLSHLSRLDPPPPVAPPTGTAPIAAQPVGLPLWPLAVVLLVALVAVPAAKHVRRWSRRRSPPRAAVVNAWRDTRDVLRDHGVPVAPGSTVRDLTGVAPVDPADVAALARCVDRALWAGRDVDPALADEAWTAATAIRRTLRDGPWQRRVRAAFAVGSLR